MKKPESDSELIERMRQVSGKAAFFSHEDLNRLCDLASKALGRHNDRDELNDLLMNNGGRAGDTILEAVKRIVEEREALRAELQKQIVEASERLHNMISQRDRAHIEIERLNQRVLVNLERERNEARAEVEWLTRERDRKEDAADYWNRRFEEEYRRAQALHAETIERKFAT